MIHEFTTVGSGKPLIYFPQKPLVVIHQAFYSLNNERFAGTSLLRSQAAKLGLQIGVKRYVHGY